MSVMNGVYRIGNDPELRMTSAGKPCLNISLAYNYGQKGPDGKKPTQWISATLWGKMAEGLAPYLTKGTQVFAVLNDVFVDQYTTKDGKPGANLKASIIQVTLIGQRGEQSQHEQQKANGYQPQSGFNDLDSDVPF